MLPHIKAASAASSIADSCPCGTPAHDHPNLRCKDRLAIAGAGPGGQLWQYWVLQEIPGVIEFDRATVVCPGLESPAFWDANSAPAQGDSRQRIIDCDAPVTVPLDIHDG